MSFKKEDFGDENGQNRHQHLKVVVNIFHLKHPSPTSMQPLTCHKNQSCHPIKGWMRFNRLFKYECFFVFNSKIVRIIKNGSLYQIGVVTFYLLYVIHLDACVYYQVSSWRNFTGQWAFNETRNWLLTSGFVYRLPV